MGNVSSFEQLWICRIIVSLPRRGQNIVAQGKAMRAPASIAAALGMRSMRFRSPEGAKLQKCCLYRPFRQRCGAFS